MMSSSRSLNWKRTTHAFIAYRHQLNAVQFAEIAVMEVQGIDEIEEIEE
jgi:hypothetical protein